MNDREFQGVILAAGRGSRMAPFSDNYPKPLLPVCNKPLIVYQIETMREPRNPRHCDTRRPQGL